MRAATGKPWHSSGEDFRGGGGGAKGRDGLARGGGGKRAAYCVAVLEGEKTGEKKKRGPRCHRVRIARNRPNGVGGKDRRRRRRGIRLDVNGGKAGCRIGKTRGRFAEGEGLGDAWESSGRGYKEGEGGGGGGQMNPCSLRKNQPLTPSAQRK